MGRRPILEITHTQEVEVNTSFSLRSSQFFGLVLVAIASLLEGVKGLAWLFLVSSEWNLLRQIFFAPTRRPLRFEKWN